MIRQAVILAAGMGTRLGSQTKAMPKGFLTVEGETLIERSCALLRRAGIQRIVIGTGHHAEWYARLSERHADIRCVLNPEFANSGSLETLGCLHNEIAGDFLLLESDLLYEYRALDTLLQAPHGNHLLASGFTHSGDEVYVEADNSFKLTNLTKDKSHAPKSVGELVGITRLTLATYRALVQWVVSQKRPSDLHYEDGLVQISRSEPIQVNCIPDLIWSEVDTQEHYKRAQQIIMPKLKELLCQSESHKKSF